MGLGGSSLPGPAKPRLPQWSENSRPYRSLPQGPPKGLSRPHLRLSGLAGLHPLDTFRCLEDSPSDPSPGAFQQASTLSSRPPDASQRSPQKVCSRSKVSPADIITYHRDASRGFLEHLARSTRGGWPRPPLPPSVRVARLEIQKLSKSSRV